ncbi:emopamil-binding protein-like [Mizuhopecten yessoensis]|uniref:Emopamil-binding protein-like n=1 Tax=Mizuhopecten yessoensis TaxID=6573 RepID=A0A210PVS5_MIZYE|nr:emopamil-binding protein-like [Mizuhopecten yessoensis]OWF40562.1 Emopamil-binding protein-like [Mizuhopecten yessoensis]
MDKDTFQLQSLLSDVTFLSLSFASGLALIGVVTGFYLGKSRGQQCILSWLVYNALTHFVLEGAFVCFSLRGTVNSTDNFLATIWKEYAKADQRWGVSDPTIVSLEILTVGLAGPLALLLCYAILRDRPYRHFVQIILCVCELYGGWMTFCPEWLQDSPNLRTDSFLYLWVYLVFFNILWVVVPLALLVQSYRDLCFAEVQKTVITETTTTKLITHKYNTRSKKND